MTKTDSNEEDSEEKKDAVFPSTLSIKEKKDLFKKFGTKKNKDDGAII